MKAVTFHVRGQPAGQGSKRLVRSKKGRTIMLEDSARTKPWRAVVRAAAIDADLRRLSGNVAVTIVILFARPPAHYRKDGRLRDSTPLRPGRLDVDKAARAILDALKGVAYADDRQVAPLLVDRHWAERAEDEGARICVGYAPAP
jgi:Holliday junction resolvase RusA-like endonuclease